MDVFAQLTRIGLCLIGFPGHVSVMKWLVAAVSRYPDVGSFIVSGLSRIVINLFCTLLYFSFFVTIAASCFLHKGSLLLTTDSLIFLLVLLSVSSSFPRLQLLFLSVAQFGWWKQFLVDPPMRFLMVASPL